MELQPIGSTSLTPRTHFLWNPENKATVELTELSDDYYLVRASKTYRIEKQDAEGKENWDRNLVQLNQHLEENFSSFQVSLDFTRTVDVDSLPVKDDAERVVKQVLRRRSELSSLEQQIESLNRSMENGFEDLQPDLKNQLHRLRDRRNQVEQDLGRSESEADLVLKKLGEWKSDGVLVAYLFSFSTDLQVARFDELEEVVSNHVDDVYDMHRHRVKQILQGPRYNLLVEELDHPRVFNRLQHTSLLQTEALTELQESNPGLAGEIESVRQGLVDQFNGFALSDLSTESGTFERGKSTPARALQAVLSDLQREKVSLNPDAPNDGPVVGTVPGTDQVVGFDPAERLVHFYISGETGSGKSYLKRVLLENCVSLGYDVLTVSPSDREEIGLSFANPDNSDGVAFGVEQYWPGSDQLLDLPSDRRELFEGVNAVTLDGLDKSRKQDVINSIFEELGGLSDLSNPLFVFLEEAHEFSQGSTADAIQEAVRETRKFGVHIGLVSQSPMDFQRQYKQVRENTSSVLMRLEDVDYPRSIGLSDPERVSSLRQGEAIFTGLEMPETLVKIRETLTLPVAPTVDQLDDLQERYSKGLPSVDRPSAEEPDRVAEKTTDEKRLVSFIKQFLSENDEAPSYSKVFKEGPFGQDKTRKLLDELVESGVLRVEEVERYGNEFKVYRPS